MPWKDLAATEKSLADALRAFDWKRTADTVDALVAQIRRAEEPLPEKNARRLLASLRRKRQLSTLARLAEALLESGQRGAQIQRQYAQALIDLDYLTPAERMLETLVREAAGTPEEHEARGLIGRIHKQIYVNNRGSRSAGSRDHLERSISEYLGAYRVRPAENLWHGINVVALTELARRDGVSLAKSLSPQGLARKILGALEERESAAVDGLDTWDLATAMEAHLALGDTRAALELGLAYTESPGADAFEIGSTLRQLTEVWDLTEKEEPGTSLLPLLRAAMVRCQGSSLTVLASEAMADSKSSVRPGLEKIFGAGRFQTLQWYQQGLDRAKSIGRIERLNGQGHGTGWLVRGEDFFPDQAGKLLVITNHHVISDPPYPGALRPSQARFRLQMLNRVTRLDQVIWSSPPAEFDATFLTLETTPKGAEPLELADEPVAMDDPPPRLYIIGHPGGRDLEFSLEDTQLLATNQKLLHYRTPTEGGSSGSPVFEDQGWQVVALHHSGRSDMVRIDGKKGTYEANEGIAIQSIRRAISGS